MPSGISSTRRDVISWRLPPHSIANRNFIPQMLCGTLRLCVKQKKLMPGEISSTRRDVISWRLPSPRLANRNIIPQMLCETLRLCVKQKISAKVRAVPAKRYLTQRRKGTQRICSFVLMSKPIRCTVEGDAII